MLSLVIAFHKNGQLNSATFEAVTAAVQLGCSVNVALFSDSPDSLAAELSKRTPGTVVTVAHALFHGCNDEAYAKVLVELVSNRKPDVILAPATLYGKAVLSRLAAILKSPMISDATSLRVNGSGLIATRPGYGGSVLSEVQAEISAAAPICISIRPKIFAPSTNGGASIETFSPSDSAFAVKTSVKEVRIESSGTVTLADADRIVSAGRGIKGPENVPMVEALAKSVGAAFGASRAVVDAGWVPYAHQVGQTGRTVNPKLYIAVGVSGAIQHLVGMQSSQIIVAINKDKDAPIFKVATYGIVGDLFEVIPALTKKFETELSR